MERNRWLERIDQLLREFPVVGLLGPRQCGKTTLAQDYVERMRSGLDSCEHYFDLEDPVDVARLEQPQLALGHLEGVVVIDEVQRRPELFPLLRTLVDRHSRRSATRFLVLGSASRHLLRQSSESLAGRIAYLELTPFSAAEVGQLDTLWLRGGYPRSVLASTDAASLRWRKAYIQTYLEQDIPGLGFQVSAPALRRFWMMLASYHGQVARLSELGRSLSVADTTVRRHLDILEGTFMLRLLQPWHENISKRQVKRPKVYFRDSGLFHALLGLGDLAALRTHPMLGASWEGFALEEIVRSLQVPREEAFFWATHNRAELDLLIFQGGRRVGFEFKYNDAPRLTASMRIAQADLRLEKLWVIFPGKRRYQLAGGIEARGLDDWLSEQNGGVG